MASVPCLTLPDTDMNREHNALLYSISALLHMKHSKAKSGGFTFPFLLANMQNLKSACLVYRKYKNDDPCIENKS